MAKRHALPERWFVQVEIDDGWSTFDIVDRRQYRAHLLAEAIRTVLSEHPTIGRHPLRVVTPSQIGSRQEVLLAEVRGQEEWVPEQVKMVREHAQELISGFPVSRQGGKDHGNATPVRVAARALESAVEALEEAVRNDPRAMRFVAEEAKLRPDSVRRIRNGDTLYATLIVTDTSLLPYATINARRKPGGEIDAQDTLDRRG